MILIRITRVLDNKMLVICGKQPACFVERGTNRTHTHISITAGDKWEQIL